MRTFGGRTPFNQTSFRLEKYLTMHLQKEERGKLGFFKQKVLQPYAGFLLRLMPYMYNKSKQIIARMPKMGVANVFPTA